MSDPPDYTGRRLGNWQLLSRLGEGAFGAVYLAHNPIIDKEAAVKVLHPHMATADIKRRFFTEARAASSARVAEGDPRPHPGVVQIFDGDDGARSGDGLCYIVMERLSGHTLHDALRRGPLSPWATAQLGQALADTLLAVHRKKVVHRDLKPENIFLLQGDPARPKILDFGIAKLREGGPGTRAGTVLGTPHYMSPEQGQGLDDVDERSDLYSLGIILYECRAGAVPFVGPNYQSLLFQHISQPPPPLPADTPAALGALIGALLAKAPADRPDAAAVRDRLRALAARLPEVAPPWPSAPAGSIAPGAPVPDTEVNRVRTVSGPVPVVPIGNAAPDSPQRRSGAGHADSVLPFTIDSTVRRPAWRRAALLGGIGAGVALGGLLALRPATHPPAGPDGGHGPEAQGRPPDGAGAVLPAPPAPRPPPPGYRAGGDVALLLEPVTIDEFRRYAEQVHLQPAGGGTWPWLLPKPPPGRWPMNQVGPAQAGAYCAFRTPGGRLPTRAERAGAPDLPGGRFPDLLADAPNKALSQIRCAVDLKPREGRL